MPNLLFYLEGNPQRYRIASNLLRSVSDQVWQLKQGETISIYVKRSTWINRIYMMKPYIVCGLELEDSREIIPLKKGIGQVQERILPGIGSLLFGIAVLFWFWKKGYL